MLQRLDAGGPHAARALLPCTRRRARVTTVVGGLHLSIDDADDDRGRPDHPARPLPPAVRRAAEHALLSGETRRLRVAGETWCAGALARPIPALVAACGAPGAATGALDEAVVRLATRVLPSAMARDPFLAVRATSPSLAPLLDALDRLARQPLPVLLLGETGTGKEVVARALHAASGRRGAFVAENCAALPESLLEAELFGARRGAFTGAERDRRGRIAESDGGTLFLDEIGDLSPSLQAKLLRVLQEKEVRPLGGEHATRVDLRVVAATHRPLPSDASFRRDLYFRLAGYVCTLPALDERRADLPFLCASLLARLADEGIGPGRRLSVEAFDTVARRAFPGNIRELDNVLRRACALADGPLVTPRDVKRPGTPREEAPANLEVAMIEQALREAAGVKAEAARRLGWSRQKLYRRLDALGLRGGS